MKYTVIAIYFFKHGQEFGKDVTTALTSLSLPAAERIPVNFNSLNLIYEAHKIADPYRNQRKDLIVIIKDNTTDEIKLYRFDEMATGKKTVSVIIP